jgi:hypothetical protein
VKGRLEARTLALFAAQSLLGLATHWPTQSLAEDRNVVAVDPKLEEIPQYNSPVPAAPPPAFNLSDCTFFPEPECAESVVIELGFAGGQSISNLPLKAFTRPQIELGYLRRVARDLHLGPTFELALSYDDVRLAWEASPRVRLRYFAASSYFVLEHAIGLQFQRFGYLQGLETGTRAGVMADASLGYRGIAGPFAQLAALADPGGNDQTYLHWAAGIRLNLVAWSVVFTGGRLIE